MTSRPLVSIGMPVYNGERFIGNAIESVLAQNHTNLEIVICDNCSTDMTEAVCLRYAAKDARIRFHRNTSNIGMTRNLLRVLSLATGDFFMWACADDIRPRNVVESLLQALVENPRAVMAHGPLIAKSRDIEVQIENAMELASADPAERVRAFTEGIAHNGMVYGLYRQDAIRQTMFTANFGQDYLLCLQMCMLGPIEYTATPMIIYWEKNRLTADPMGDPVPLSLESLVDFNPRARKCWVVLGLGCLYLFRLRERTLPQRMTAFLAYVSAFTARYGRRLRKDLILIALAPFSWSIALIWSQARRFPPALRLGRTVKTLFKQS